MRWLLRVIAEWILIVAFASLASIHWALIWPAAILVGIRIHAIGSLGHLGSHRLSGLPRSINDWLTAVLAFGPVGISLAKYRRFHGAHHHSLGIPGKDPEVEIVTRFKNVWTKYHWTHSVKDLLGLHTYEALIVTNYMSTWPSRIIPALLVALTFYISVPVGIAVVLAPVTGLIFAHRLRAWTEHDHLSYPGITKLTAPPVWWRRAIYLPHNTWLHWEHHMSPGSNPAG
jgi:fatty acid desaturase